MVVGLAAVLYVTGAAGPMPAARPSGTVGAVDPLAPAVGSPSAAALEITNFTATPDTLVEATATQLTVVIAGGAAPFTFAYSDLPFGCQSYNGSSIRCIPGASGSFLVEVQVTDAAGQAAWANVSLTVTSGYGRAPIVSSFEASPSTITLGQSTSLSVAAVSQSSTPTAFLALTYFGLPRGCATFNQTPLTCLPTEAGRFVVQVEVVDGFGDYAYANATLTVQSPPSPGGGTSLPVWAYGAIAAGVAVVVIAGVYAVRRHA